MGSKAFLKVAGIFFVLVTFSFFLFLPGTYAFTEEEIEASIELGLSWLVAQQSLADGSWEGSVARTGFAVVKLEDRAFELGYDSPFADDYPYKDNVINGLDYIFSRAANDDCGIHFINRDTYDTGIAMMAIAAGKDMTRVVPAVVPVIGGMTYGQVLEANISYFANAQRTSPTYEGGFGYGCGDPLSHSADNSNSGYAVLGMQFAETTGITIPGAIKTQLDIWIDLIQCDDGASEYYPTFGCYWPNCLKTGNLLSELAFIGELKDSARAQLALSYIGGKWYGENVETGWGYDPTPVGSIAQYQATYTLMKGLESMGIVNDEIPGVSDWFQDFADVIVAQQDVTGYWASSPAYVLPGGAYGTMSGTVLSTVWALLTLERVAPPSPYVSFDIKPGSCPNPINVKSKGVIPAAIMGTADLDVTQIDPSSLKLRLPGSETPVVSPLRWAYVDVGEPFEPFVGKEDCELDCAGCSCADGFMDLVFHFDKQEVVTTLKLDTVDDNQCLVLEIIGTLKEEFGSRPIIGEDVVRILVKGKK